MSGSSSAGASYEAVPYPSRPYLQAHPDRLFVVARLAGLDPVPPGQARVLELGCGAGGHLVPLALDLPGASALGIDASPSAIAEGQALSEALDLGSRLTLRSAALEELRPDELPSADYVLAHGVYSWVSPAAQARLLELIAACLSPRGVAFVSYNALPGWRLRGLARDVALRHVDPSLPPRERVEALRETLAGLAAAAPEGSPTAAALQREAALLGDLGAEVPGYLFHELFGPYNEALYLGEFVQRAAGVGLRYLGDAEQRAECLLTTVFPAEAGGERGSAAFVQGEEARDLLTGRSLRASLLVPAEASLGAGPPGARQLAGLHLACEGRLSAGQDHEAWLGLALDPHQEVRYEAYGGPPLVVKLPSVCLAIQRLGHAWPLSVPWEELVRDVTRELVLAGRPKPGPLLAQAVWEAFARGQLELRPRPLSCSGEVAERPRGCPLARLQAAEPERRVTNRRHESLVLGRPQAALLVLCDGERDASSLVDGLVERALAGELELSDEAGAISDPVRIRAALAAYLPDGLAYLRGHALLV